MRASSPGRRNAPPEKRGEIARLFRLGVPTARVATVPGSRRNTAYRYCKRIRRRRAAARQAALDPTSYTEVWQAYKKLSLNGFHHKRINHYKTLVNGMVHINGLENFRGYA